MLIILFFRTIKKIVNLYKMIGYNINVLWQTICMVVNPNAVHNFACQLHDGESDILSEYGSFLNMFQNNGVKIHFYKNNENLWLGCATVLGCIIYLLAV